MYTYVIYIYIYIYICASSGVSGCGDSLPPGETTRDGDAPAASASILYYTIIYNTKLYHTLV